jgi:hypothetical protein
VWDSLYLFLFGLNPSPSPYHVSSYSLFWPECFRIEIGIREIPFYSVSGSVDLEFCLYRMKFHLNYFPLYFSILHPEVQFSVWQIFENKWLLEHIFKKIGSTEIVVSSVRPSVCPSIRPSVSYFSAAIAPRELKF